MDGDVSLDTSGMLSTTVDTSITDVVVDCFESYIKDLQKDETKKPRELVILEEVMKTESETPQPSVFKALSCLLIFWKNRIEPQMKKDDFAVVATNALRLTIRIENELEAEETYKTLEAIFNEVGKDDSVVLSSTNNLLFVLFFTFLYPENTSKVLKTVEDTTYAKYESNFLMKLICYCNYEKDELKMKLETSSIKGNAQIAKRLMENFLKSYDCSMMILSHFFEDMQYLSTFPAVDNGPINTIEVYSHSLLEFIKEQVENRNYGSIQNEQLLKDRTLPYLISQGYTAREFLLLIQKNSKWTDFEKNLKSIIYTQPGITQVEERTQQQKGQVVQQVGQELQQQLEEQCMEWVKNHAHLEQLEIYKHVLGRIRNTINSTSIEVKGDPLEEAVMMSAFVKSFIEFIDKKGNKMTAIVCLVLENADDFDKLSKKPTGYVFSKFDGSNPEVFDSDCIIYCSRADSKDIPKKDDKPIFGVISWVEPVNETVDRLSTLSPTMVLVYIFVQLFLKIKKLSKTKIADTKVIKDALLNYLRKEQNDKRIFNEPFFEQAINNYCGNSARSFHWETEWIKNEVSISKKDEKVKKNTLSDVKSRFTAEWICLTDILPKQNGLPQKEIKKAYGQAKELVPFLLKDETSWLDAIEEEVKQSIENGKTVVVTTKSLFHQKVETKLKNTITISTDTCLAAKNVFIFNISNRLRISSNADIHVVSTCFPSDECQYSRLAGMTVCEKKLFTQRFVVNKEHLPADLAECFCYREMLKSTSMSVTDASLADATPFDPMSKARSDRSFQNIFRLHFDQWKECRDQRDVCLTFLREAMRKMNDRSIKTERDFLDAKFDHQQLFMIRLKKNLNFTSPIDEKCELYGKTLAGLELNSAFKHFCEFKEIGDLTDQARNVKAIRLGKHSDVMETILFLKKGEKPESAPTIEGNQAIPRHKLFKDHLACNLEFKRGEVISIKMLTGDFVILVKDDDDSLYHFERKYCKIDEKDTITIYSHLKEGENILELLKEQYGKSSTLRNLLQKYEVLLDEKTSTTNWYYCTLM